MSLGDPAECLNALAVMQREGKSPTVDHFAYLIEVPGQSLCGELAEVRASVFAPSLSLTAQLLFIILIHCRLTEKLDSSTEPLTHST